MTWNDDDADVLARLEEDLEEHDPDLAMQFLALAHPALRAAPRPRPLPPDEVPAAWRRLSVALVVVVLTCSPGVLFGAWTVVSAAAVIGGMVLGLAALGSLIADRGDRSTGPAAHPSNRPA